MPACLSPGELQRIRAIAAKRRNGEPIRFRRYRRDVFYICDALLAGKAERIFSTCTAESFDSLWRQGEAAFREALTR